jgi:hypothetical protein
MNLSQYLDGNRFPLTSRPWLPPRQQIDHDAADLDSLREYLAGGVTPTADQWARLAELEEKAAARSGLIDQFGDLDPSGQ